MDSSDDDFRPHSTRRISSRKLKHFWDDISEPDTISSSMKNFEVESSDSQSEIPIAERRKRSESRPSGYMPSTSSASFNLQLHLSDTSVSESDLPISSRAKKPRISQDEIEELFHDSQSSQDEFEGFHQKKDYLTLLSSFRNLKTITREITSSQNACFDWIKAMELIAPVDLQCPKCLSKGMNGILKYYSNQISFKDMRKGGVRLQCTGEGMKCRMKYSPFKNTFFDGLTCHISIDKVIELIYCWLHQLSVTHAEREVQVTKKTVIDYYNYCRELCATSLSDNECHSKLGGPGKIVEIDESKFFRRKYNRGRLASTFQEGWVFGGVERETGKVFMKIVENRTKETLLPIIEAFIEEGTTIISDEWKAYNDLKSLGYTHRTICHKRNFVSPEDKSVHTQNIEINWRYAKKQYPDNSTSPALRDSYLQEYMYRHLHKKRVVSQFFCDIRKYYKHKL